ncbi:MAG: RAD55 family ATPase [Candidatus Sigynarchaeota archaeon]
MPEENPYIPKELLKMLELPYGYSILLKGDGGVGKSTLALELLVKSKGKNATYLSTRVVPTQLFEHFPWIDKSVQENIAVFDATQAGVTITNPLQDEQLALKFAGMPDLLRSIVDMADHAKGELLVCIDSWDAIQLMFEHLQAEKYADKPQMTESLNFMYNVFMSMVRQKNIKLILIAENASKMDYLVDAIVELRREFVTKENMIRVAEIKKSRGIRIDNTSYVFTLEDGRFKTFMPWDVRLVHSFKNTPANIAFDEKNLKTVFGAIFSRNASLQVGTIAISPNASWLFELWIENLARTQLYRNEMMTFTPPDSFDVQAFKVKMLAFLKEMKLDPARYEANIKIFTTEPADEPITEKNISIIPFEAGVGIDESSAIKFITRFADILNTWKNDGGFKHQINVGVMQPFASRFKEPSVAKLAINNLLRRFSVLDNATLIILTFLDDPYIIELQKVSAFFIEMTLLHGTPVLKVVSPQLQSAYGMLLSPGDLGGKMNFMIYPIV